RRPLPLRRRRYTASTPLAPLAASARIGPAAGPSSAAIERANMAYVSRERYTRRAFVGLAGAGLVGTALGCSAPAAAPAAPKPAAGAPAAAPIAPAAAAPAAPVPLQYGTISKTAWDWPRFIALQKGYFERAGFET